MAEAPHKIMHVHDRIDKTRPPLKEGSPPIGQEGSILVGLIITMTLIAVLSSSLVYVTTTSSFGELFANRQARAYYLAESGGRYAIPRIKADRDQALIDLHGKTFIFNNGDKFILFLDTTLANKTLLESQGIVHEGEWLESSVTITYEVPITYLFEYGAFGGSDKVLIGDNAYIDSYDSAVGPWSEATRNQNGHIGTNTIGKRAIEVKKNAIVYGDATVGVGGDPLTDIKVDAGAQITGNRIALVTARDMTPMVMPAGWGAPIDFTLDQFDIYTYTEGVYRLNTFEIGDDALLTISGNVTLLVEDSIQIGDRGSMDILPGSSLTIYGDGELKVQQDARVNQNGTPGQLIIYGTANFDPVKIMHRAVMKAAIYAPDAKAQITKSTEFFGSIIAGKIELKDDVKFHYDEALGRSNGVGGDIVQYF